MPEKIENPKFAGIWGSCEMAKTRMYFLKNAKIQEGKLIARYQNNYLKKGFFNCEIFANIAVRFSQVRNRL